MKKIEYRVRPVTRYIVTEYHETGEYPQMAAGCRTVGEFDNESNAGAVMRAMASQARADGCEAHEFVTPPQERASWAEEVASIASEIINSTTSDG